MTGTKPRRSKGIEGYRDVPVRTERPPAPRVGVQLQVLAATSTRLESRRTITTAADIPITAQPQQYHAGSSRTLHTTGRGEARPGVQEPNRSALQQTRAWGMSGPVRIQEQNRTGRTLRENDDLFRVRRSARPLRPREARERLVVSRPFGLLRTALGLSTGTANELRMRCPRRL